MLKPARANDLSSDEHFSVDGTLIEATKATTLRGFVQEWLKTVVGMLRKTQHPGVFKVGWVFTFAAVAFNLVRMRNFAVVSSA